MIKNRASRRKAALRVVNNVIKGREVALKKPQYGIGFNITNQLCAIIFWRWTWVVYDRRAK